MGYMVKHVNSRSSGHYDIFVTKVGLQSEAMVYGYHVDGKGILQALSFCMCLPGRGTEGGKGKHIFRLYISLRSNEPAISRRKGRAIFHLLPGGWLVSGVPLGAQLSCLMPAGWVLGSVSS